MSDFLSTCLLHKPDDIFKYTKEYFSLLCKEPDISRLVIIIGPSGVGKGTLIKKLMSEFSEDLKFSISHTTRKPRAGEEDGKDYYFVSQEKFLDILNKEGFLEYNFFNDNYYGTSKKEVKRISDENKICLLEVDINGAKKIYQSGSASFYIGVFPPNPSVLRERLNNRGTESHEQINQRLKTAHREVEEMQNVNFLNAKIINDDVDLAYEKLKNSIVSFFPYLDKEQANRTEEMNRQNDNENRKDEQIKN